MPRANRYYRPGRIWHVTHRCHQKEYLLKFAKDRSRWRYWLYEARKRYELSVLNFIVTSNHIHLLVRDRGQGEIARSMQLVASRTAQEFNVRKCRKGAYWEDRYHATAIDTDRYLAQCIVYIDLNMVRAGVASHPADWVFSGYHEIQQTPKRYRIIDMSALVELFDAKSVEQYQRMHNDWIDAALVSMDKYRNPIWTESLAVGSQDYVKKVGSEFSGPRGKRSVTSSNGIYVFREPVIPYMPFSGIKR